MRVILDACANHEGKQELMVEMIKQAKLCGADMIKWQLYEAQRLRPNYPDYDNKFQQYNKTMLRLEDILLIEEECRRNKIQSLYTVFNIPIVGIFAAWTHRRDIIKIASPDCNNWDLIDKCLKLFEKVIISTGMHYGHEIKEIVKRYGKNNKQIILFYCRSIYPIQEDFDYTEELPVIDWIKNNFIEWGISDHGNGITPIMTYLNSSLGLPNLYPMPDYIERHFILKHDPSKKDDKVSSTPSELLELTGFPFKPLCHDEIENRNLYIGKWDG